MDRGLRQVAIGILLSDAERRRRVQAMTDTINALYGTIRSASNNDGMPHTAGCISDSVAGTSIRAEELAEVRKVEQSRIDAVEWADRYILDSADEDAAESILKAIKLFYAGKKDEYLNVALMDDRTTINLFHRLRRDYLHQILKYLFFE